MHRKRDFKRCFSETSRGGLTTFDKKMYEEALREEGREEFAEKYAELSRKHKSLAKDHAERLLEKGVPYEIAREVVTELPKRELKKYIG